MIYICSNSACPSRHSSHPGLQMVCRLCGNPMIPSTHQPTLDPPVHPHVDPSQGPPGTCALVTIATGDQYWRFISPLLRSASQFFVPHDTVLFTDCPREFEVECQIKAQSLGYPRETLHRYSTILCADNVLSQYDYVYWADVDMLFVDTVGPEIFSRGITATHHAGYGTSSSHRPYETNPQSRAYLKDGKHYYCGGFVGGTSQSFLKMAQEIAEMVEDDDKRGHVAVWHDESHLNRYLNDHPPAKTLTPSYCSPVFPNRQFFYGLWPTRYAPKIVSLTKTWKEL